MCAIPDKATTEQYRARKGRQRAYKVVLKGTARPHFFTNTGVAYQPGRNLDRRPAKTYLGYARGCRRGFHCYVNREHACSLRDQTTYKLVTVVSVTFDPADVIAVEVPGKPRRQIVVRALHISNRAWKQAGLPAKKGGTL